jgi:methylmalonyl-CoA mutase cobalamin-binding subunit
MITLGQEAIDASGAQFARNDFASGKFDVVVDVGPASTTRRDATVRALAGMAQVAGASDPELANVLLSTALVNMDGEGIDDVQKWVRGRLVRNGVLKPTDEEKAAMEQEAQNQQPDPNSTLALAAADQAKAEADKARAGTIKTLADTELVKAKTASRTIRRPA